MGSPSSVTVHDQTNLLPKGQVLAVYGALAFGLLVSFVDQNSIGVALPTIGRELNAASTIEWAGTSTLIAQTAFQVLYGRLSDVFGRKVILVTMFAILALSDLLCGFAKSGPQLYVFRGIAGTANGGIMALSMIVISDVVTLEERGKYQGILGSCVGLGNAVGPFITAAFTEHTSWRNTFYLLCPLSAMAGVVLFIKLPPQNMPKETFHSTLAKIDWGGTFLASGGTILILIPISGVGSRFEAGSPMVLSMLTLGGVFLIAFILNEWKMAKLPMIPLSLFRSIPLSAMMIQNVLFGIVWFSEVYFLPVYFQSARQLNLTTSALLLLPLVLALGVASAFSGQYISRMNRYGEVIWLGFFMWTLTAGLHLLLSQTTPISTIAVILGFEGIGVGCIFQPTLVAAQAHCSKADRAVVISARNFFRSLGGAVGLAISSAVFSNSLRSHLPTHLPNSIQESVHNSTFATPNLTGLDQSTRHHILSAYAAASKSIFILWTAVIWSFLLLMILVKDKGLRRKEELTEIGAEARVNHSTTSEGPKSTRYEEPRSQPIT